MARRRIVFILVLTLSAFAESVSIRLITDADSKDPQFTVDSVQLQVDTETDEHAKFLCRDIQWLNRAGEPRIPWRVLTVLLPPDVDLSTISVTMQQSDFKPVNGKCEVQPMPPMATWKNGNQIVIWPKGKRIIDGQDADIYERDAFWPKAKPKLLNTGQLRKWQLVRLAVPLARYNPVSGELLKLISTDVAVTFDRTSRAKAMAAYDGRPDKVGKERLQKLALNFEQAVGDYDAIIGDIYPVDAKAIWDEPNIGYTIITTSAIEANSTRLADFVTHKQSLGYDVQVITEGDFGGGTGDTAAENIRSWLQGHYLSDNVGYVLLIGNPDPNIGDVPMKMLWPRQEEEFDRESPSDYYYADLTGNWDLDADGYYGEWEDDFGVGGVDRFWEVLVGRIPYYGSMSELDAILEKTIYYETQIGSEEDWRKNALLAMNPLSSSEPSWRIGEEIKDSILAPAGLVIPSCV